MNAAIAITVRELRDKSRLFLTAAALALVPFLVTWLPGSRHFGDPSVVALVAGFLAVALGLGVATTLGASTIGRELSDGRLSFYFSKPIAPWAIWVGKAAASLVAAIGCFAIVALPAMLYAGEAWEVTWPLSALASSAATAGASIVLFFVTHVAATMIRSRSPLVALDFALLVVAASAIALTLRPLALAGAVELAGRTAAAIGGALLVALAAAPVAQLAFGRTEKRRSHAALSKFLWPAVGAIVLLAALFVIWVLRVTPDDLVRGESSLAQSPQNGWLWITGRAENRGDYAASFLISPEGKWERVPPIWWGAMFSRDGRRVAWLEPRGWRAQSLELMVLDLTRPGAKPVATGLTGISGNWDFVLSDDGRLLATISNGTVTVHDVDAKRMLVSARGLLESVAGQWFYFQTPDLLRIVEFPFFAAPAPRTPVYWELDIRKRRLTKTGTGEPVAAAYPLTSPDGTRVFYRREGRVVDSRTGAKLFELPPGGYGSTIFGDGGIGTVREAAGRTTIALYAPDGTPRGEVALPGTRTAVIRGEVAPGKVVVNGTAENRVWRAFIVDAASMRIERIDDSFHGPFTAWRGTDPRPLPIDGTRPLVGYSGPDRLVRWDPRTGRMTPLALR